MDYRERAVVRVHADLDAWRAATEPARVFAFSGSGATRYSDVGFEEGDSLLFGPESAGLGKEILESAWLTDVLYIPMRPGVRSLNLANAVSVVIYEAWRQHDYSGGGAFH
jgi:tRNA (cytidine/uridine-2'-O-)-methyltransferase